MNSIFILFWGNQFAGLYDSFDKAKQYANEDEFGQDYVIKQIQLNSCKTINHWICVGDCEWEKEKC